MSYTRISSCTRVDADVESAVSSVDVVADELLIIIVYVDVGVSIADVDTEGDGRSL